MLIQLPASRNSGSFILILQMQDSFACSNRSAWTAAASSDTSASSSSAFTSQESKGKPVLV
uniref:Uncharacterized protein n=1 Tax=Arundo donax TaxID=35708 RepID=A0A0A9GBF4_ARUDO